MKSVAGADGSRRPRLNDQATIRYTRVHSTFSEVPVSPSFFFNGPS